MAKLMSLAAFRIAGLFVIVALSSTAHAGTRNWQAELDQYRNEIRSYSDGGLFLSQASNYGLTVAGCAGSSAVTAIAFVSDSIPLTNPVAEWIGNSANAQYKSYNAFFEWETMANLGRGSVGGAAIAGYESIELILLWLGGDTSTAFSQTAKVYASSYAALDQLFSTESV
jgi:hypothetical protein